MLGNCTCTESCILISTSTTHTHARTVSRQPTTRTHTRHVADTSGPAYKPPIHEGTNWQHYGVDRYCLGTAPGNSHVPT